MKYSRFDVALLDLEYAVCNQHMHPRFLSITAIIGSCFIHPTFYIILFSYNTMIHVAEFDFFVIVPICHMCSFPLYLTPFGFTGFCFCSYFNFFPFSPILISFTSWLFLSWHSMSSSHVINVMLLWNWQEGKFQFSTTHLWSLHLCSCIRGSASSP